MDRPLPARAGSRNTRRPARSKFPMRENGADLADRNGSPYRLAPPQVQRFPPNDLIKDSILFRRRDGTGSSGIDHASSNPGTEPNTEHSPPHRVLLRHDSTTHNENATALVSVEKGSFASLPGSNRLDWFGASVRWREVTNPGWPS